MANVSSRLRWDSPLDLVSGTIDAWRWMRTLRNSSAFSSYGQSSEHSESSTTLHSAWLLQPRNALSLTHLRMLQLITNIVVLIFFSAANQVLGTQSLTGFMITKSLWTVLCWIFWWALVSDPKLRQYIQFGTAPCKWVKNLKSSI